MDIEKHKPSFSIKDHLIKYVSKGWIQLGLFISVLLLNLSILFCFIATKDTINHAIESIYLTTFKLDQTYTSAVFFFNLVHIFIWITLFFFMIYIVSIYLKNKRDLKLHQWFWTILITIIVGLVFVNYIFPIYQNLDLYNKVLNCKTVIENNPECLELTQQYSTLSLFGITAQKLSSKIVIAMTYMVLLFIFSLLTFFLLVQQRRKIQYQFINLNKKESEVI